MPVDPARRFRERPGVDEKTDLRAEVARRIAALSLDKRVVLDARIATNITQLSWWDRADSVFGYIALSDEVDLHAVFRAAIKAGKQVALPRIDAAGMSFRRVDAEPVDLERHSHGFLQPADSAPRAEADEHTLVLVPGRGFDRRGARTGRGGGYYDVALTAFAHGVHTVGVCYATQLFSRVPETETDRRVHAVVTDNETVIAAC